MKRLAEKPGSLRFPKTHRSRCHASVCGSMSARRHVVGVPRTIPTPAAYAMQWVRPHVRNGNNVTRVFKPKGSARVPVTTLP
jgi:hypothetical protein